MAKVLKKKYFEVEIPAINEKAEVLAGSVEELENKTIRMDMTRALRGKSSDMVFQVKIKDGKPIGIPKKFTVLPFFIKHMLHLGVSYVEDSFIVQSKESELSIKPFLITRKKVSRAVSRTIRNSAKNWITDYAKEKTDAELFNDILSGELQKALSLRLKKIYPLGLCEIRIIEVKKPLAEIK